MRFEIIDTNDGVPSFGEVLSNSWNALAMAAIVIALLAVAIAPFASVLLVIGLPLSMAIKRRRSARAEARPSRPAPPVPPAEDSGDTTITEDAAMGA